MPRELLQGNNVTDLLPAILAEQTKQNIAAVLSGQQMVSYEYQMVAKNGLGYFECKMTRLDERHVIAKIANITVRKLAEEKVLVRDERFRKLFELHAAAMLLIDPESGAIVDANQAAANLYGWPVNQLKTMTIQQINSAPPEIVAHEIDRARLAECCRFEFEHRTADGSNRMVEVFSSIITMRDDEKQVLFSIIHDITERKQNEERVVYLSFHDILTGLYNRSYFEEEIGRMDTARQLPISVINGDVNSLKMTNDVFGHAKGDALIITAAQILKSCCREEDVVVRYGGDEFVAFLPKCDEQTARSIVKRVHEKCRDKTIEGVPVSLALGFATKVNFEEDINAVVSLAETRMYKNKISDDNRVRYETLNALEQLAFKKDYHTKDHAERMQVLATGFGEHLRLPGATISDIAMLATLHDIGKIAVSEEILKKQESLTDAEWAVVRTHPDVGYRILRAIRELSFGAEEAVLAHHEHWNGAGYPRGLNAEGIPFISRLITIIDAYDVMTHDRPYRNAMTHEMAVAELKRCAGTQFDPELVEKFLEFIDGQ